jgi:hypothetical protein
VLAAGGPGPVIHLKHTPLLVFYYYYSGASLNG